MLLLAGGFVADVSARGGISRDWDGLDTVSQMIANIEPAGDDGSWAGSIDRDAYIDFLGCRGGLPPRVTVDSKESLPFGLPPLPIHAGLDVLGNVEAARAAIPEAEDLVRRWCVEAPASDLETASRPRFAMGVGSLSLSEGELGSLRKMMFEVPRSIVEDVDVDGDGIPDRVVGLDVDGAIFTVTTFSGEGLSTEDDRGRCVLNRGPVVTEWIRQRREAAN